MADGGGVLLRSQRDTTVPTNAEGSERPLIRPAFAGHLLPQGEKDLYWNSSSNADNRAAWSSAISGLITSSRASPSMILGRL